MFAWLSPFMVVWVGTGMLSAVIMELRERRGERYRDWRNARPVILPIFFLVGPIALALLLIAVCWPEEN